MKILITGANGFLGFNIIDRLLKSNHDILALSRNFDRFTQIKNTKIKFSKIISNLYTCQADVITDFIPDIAIHCAWAGGNNYNDINHTDQYNNISAGISLLEILSRLKKPPTFIGVGSFAEYGKIETKALESQLENPITHYGLAKNTFKNISKLFCELNSMQWTWIRPCYIYGNGDVETRLIPSIIYKIKKGEQITLDSCNTTIDYLHITDFSRAIQSIINTNQIGIFNVCSGKEYYLKDIINYIIEKKNCYNQIVFNNPADRKYSSKYICGDNNKIITNTNWMPKINIYDGINSLI